MNILDNALVHKIEAIYEILIQKHTCVWGHGTQHMLCDHTCHCLCKTTRFQGQETKKHEPEHLTQHDKKCCSFHPACSCICHLPHPPPSEKVCWNTECQGTAHYGTLPHDRLNEKKSCRQSIDEEVEGMIEKIIVWAYSSPTLKLGLTEKLHELVKLAKELK